MVGDDCDDDVTAVNYKLRWSKEECILNTANKNSRIFAEPLSA